MTHFSTAVLLSITMMTAFMGEKTLASDHKPKDKYLQGYYYDSQGHKFEGLIAKDDLNFQFFLFKKHLGDSAQKIEPGSCDSFVVDHRSFHTLNDVTIKAIVWWAHFDKAFAELVTDGPVQLYSIRFEPGKQGYMHYVAIASNFTGGLAGQAVGMLAGKENASYFLRRGQDTTYLRIEKKTFTDQITGYLQDDTTLVQKLRQNPDYSIHNIELIIAEYDQDKR